MRKYLIIVLAAVVSSGMTLGSLTPAQPAAADDMPPFVQMLTLAPSSAAASPMVGYADFRAIVAARPGATPLNTSADWAAFQASHSAGAALAFAALNGLSVGDSNLMSYFLQIGDGIDAFSIQRELHYGDPPGHLLLLNGDFDPVAISGALTAKGFVQSDLSDVSHNLTVVCHPQGCDQGAKLDMTAIDVANPFGGNLGRKEPIAISPNYLFGSVDLSVFQDQLNAFQGKGDTLAKQPDFAALAEAVMAQGTLIQIEILDPKLTDMPFDPTKVPAAVRAALTKMLSHFAPIPAYSRVAMAHLVKDNSQLAVVALVYNQAADAQTAAQVIPARLSQYQSIATHQAFAQLLAERNATLDTPQVYTAANGQSVLLLTFRAPIESSTPDANGRYQQSGLLFHLFVQMVEQRDTYWLISAVPSS